MKDASLFGTRRADASSAAADARPLHPGFTGRDAFRAKAAKPAQPPADRFATAPARTERTRPSAHVDAFAAHASRKPASKAFYNPFGSTPIRPAVEGKPVQRAPLQLVSSRRVVATPNPADAVEEGRLLKVGGGGAVWVASGAPVFGGAVSPVRASTPDTPSDPAPSPEPGNDYWSQPATPSQPAAPPPARKGKGGGGNSGGGSGGDSGGASGGGEKMGKARTGYKERIFDQDDLTGLLIGVALLLLLGWMWLQGRTGQPEEEASLQPQMAANEPEAPAPDPFGRGPVDLRPTSPIPDAVEDPVVEPLELQPTPAEVIEAPRLPDTSASSGPSTQLANVTAAADAPSFTQAFFCTASSSLTPAGRVQLDRQIAQWKASGASSEFIVTGFADTRGTTDFNMQLGALRADYVADLLRAEGFTVVEAVSVGELDDIDDEQNCPNQRRVDIALKGAVLSTPTRACAPPADVQPLACS